MQREKKRFGSKAECVKYRKATYRKDLTTETNGAAVIRKNTDTINVHGYKMAQKRRKETFFITHTLNLIQLI